MPDYFYRTNKFGGGISNDGRLDRAIKSGRFSIWRFWPWTLTMTSEKLIVKFGTSLPNFIKKIWLCTFPETTKSVTNQPTNQQTNTRSDHNTSWRRQWEWQSDTCCSMVLPAWIMKAKHSVRRRRTKLYSTHIAARELGLYCCFSGGDSGVFSAIASAASAYNCSSELWVHSSNSGFAITAHLFAPRTPILHCVSKTVRFFLLLT